MPASSSSSTSCQRFSLRRPGHVGVGQLVDQRDRRAGGRGRRRVSISSNVDAAVLDRPPRDDLEVAELGRGVGPAVGLDVADDDVGAALVRGADPR